MKFGSRRILDAVGTAVVCLLGIASASGQAAPAQKPLMAEDVFKNVQVLKGISVNEFMGTMGFFSAALGLNCIDCHVDQALDDWAKFAEDVPRKRMARQMILMVNASNKANFGGRRAITCYTCHRGSPMTPRITPSLTEQYSTPGPEDPDEVELLAQVAPGAPTADQVLDKFIQAVGGAQRLAGLTSYTAKGTYAGFDTGFVKAPMELFAKAPGQRTIIAHPPDGNSTWTFDGRAGWVATLSNPVPLLPVLPGGELDGTKLAAELSFPGGIKQDLSAWRAGFEDAAINDRPVQVIQGTAPGKTRVKLYFDKENGLLVRVLWYTNTMVGINPTQIDYSDYREVAGVKIPFKWTLTWTDGQSSIELSDVQPNVPIDSAKFAKPVAPVAAKAK